jgi:glycosyltransferase involved in cell wall biosynthesis
MPRVSVIIPAYNAERYLAETLGSVAAQTYDDWEVVVGDDGSTDATLEIAESFGVRVKVVRAESNAGPATARNRAVAHSSGELLALLDADDLWEPDYLEHQVSLFDTSQARYGDVGGVACNARVLGPAGFFERTYADYVGAPSDVTLGLLLHGNFIFVSALAPRSVVDEAGGFSPNIYGAEDFDLWIRILELGYRIVSTRRPLAIYRLSPGSVSADAASLARATQKVYIRALERGNLAPGDRRIARRELRLQRAVERVGAGGFSFRTLAREAPRLAVVAIEHPRRWRSYARMIRRRQLQLSAFPS